MSRLSICMIVKNEASNLPGLLRSIEPLEAELVVVDTGSSDETVAIARASGAKIVSWEWRRDFAAARNVSLEQATRPWILWLDADDRVPAVSLPAILQLSSGNADKAYSFLIKNTTDEGQTGTEFSQIRMFPNHPRLRFTGAVHEQVYPALVELGIPFEHAEILIHHTGYTDPETIKAKQARNRAILEARVSSGEGGAIQWYQLGTTMQDLGDLEEAEKGFRRSLELVRAGDPDQHLASVLPSHLAMLRLTQEDVQGAYDVYRETLDPDPSTWHPNQTSLVAQVWARVEGIDAALEYWEKAFTPSVRQALLPVDPKLVSILPLQTLAEHWKSRGEQELAIEILKILKAVLENQRPPRSVLPEAYLRHGKPERAAELFAWCLEKDGEEPGVWDLLVQSLRRSGQSEQALVFAEAGRGKWPGDARFSEART